MIDRNMTIIQDLSHNIFQCDYPNYSSCIHKKDVHRFDLGKSMYVSNNTFL